VAAADGAAKQREIAQLAFDRTRIRSHADGVVLKRFVVPGAKRGVAQDDPDSAAILSLFDPAHLQVRVDVPIAEAGRLEVGQPARISTAMLPNRAFTGEVTRVVGQADLQRNTLQAKVAIRGPDPRMRPDVLCRVEFMSVPRRRTADGAAAASSAEHSLWVPVAALGEAATDEQEVWVVDPVERRAARRVVRLGHERREGYRRVLEGLHPNEIVITRPGSELREGGRVAYAADEEGVTP